MAVVNSRSTTPNDDSATDAPAVTLTHEAGVDVLTLTRPPVNALDTRLLDEIARAVAEAADREDCTALVVRGTGRVFSAGADLRMVRALLTEEGVEAVTRYVARMQAVFAELHAVPLPTVAAIRGAAVGGGLELALACDLRVAATDAKLGLPEIRHGLLPGAGGTQRITRLAGPGVAARLMLTGDLVSGVEAERLRIVEWAVPDAVVDATAVDLAARMGTERLAAAAIKDCIELAAQAGQAGFERELSASRELYATDRVQRRLAAF